MTEDLLTLQLKVNTIIYNPFINLKEQVAELIKMGAKSGVTASHISRLEEIIATLDQLENLNHGSVERIKGFNKSKAGILKIIKEIENSPGK